jgi:plastocyanin
MQPTVATTSRPGPARGLKIGREASEHNSMRVRRAIVAAFLVVAAVVSAAGVADARRVSRDTAVGVAEREFRIGVYRSSVPAGAVRLNVTNFGEDAHDLAVMAPGGRMLALSPEIGSGRRHRLAVRLTRPGVYRLLCTKLDHAARGMRATVRVVAPRR